MGVERGELLLGWPSDEMFVSDFERGEYVCENERERIFTIGSFSPWNRIIESDAAKNDGGGIGKTRYNIVVTNG